MKKNFLILFFFICSLSNELFAQAQLDKIYDANFHTVLLYNIKKEQSFPQIELGSNDYLLLQFDDLREDNSTYMYTYTIEHCSAEWELSSISPMEYVDGFNRNFITNYRFSSNTIQPYTHYELTFPNNDVKFKLSGNYILKVYDSNNEDVVLFSKRFVVYQPIVIIDHTLRRSTVINDRNKKQKIDFSILHSGFPIDNPFDQLKVWVLPNESWERGLLNTKPSFFNADVLNFDYVDANIFDGLSEHRRFDIRSTRFLAEKIRKIENDPDWKVYLLEDYPKNPLRYTEDLDMNGNYFISRTDMGNSSVNGDYAKVYFTYNHGAQNPYGEFYVLGRFNNWTVSEDCKMTYNIENRRYEAVLYLKQGIYDYMIGFKSAKSNVVDYSLAEGNFYEAENDYRILVYYRRTGKRYDELIGMKTININP